MQALENHNPGLSIAMRHGYRWLLKKWPSSWPGVQKTWSIGLIDHKYITISQRLVVQNIKRSSSGNIRNKMRQSLVLVISKRTKNLVDDAYNHQQDRRLRIKKIAIDFHYPTWRQHETAAKTAKLSQQSKSIRDTPEGKGGATTLRSSYAQTLPNKPHV